MPISGGKSISFFPAAIDFFTISQISFFSNGFPADFILLILLGFIELILYFSKWSMGAEVRLNKLSA